MQNKTKEEKEKVVNVNGDGDVDTADVDVDMDVVDGERFPSFFFLFTSIAITCTSIAVPLFTQYFLYAWMQ